VADRSTAHANALPGWEQAQIKDEKLAEYALNPSHTYGESRGADKARVFKSALGFDQSNWRLLKQAILDGLPSYEAVFTLEDEHGRRYRVTMRITGPNGRAAHVLTAWIIRPGTDRPDLITAYVLKEGESAK
jgi:hypothetical protein